MSEYLQFDMGSELDDINYKSCFSRSVALNARYKQTKTDQPNEQINGKNAEIDSFQKPCVRPFNTDTLDVRMRKTSRSGVEESRRMSCGSIGGSIRRSSLCSIRSNAIPVDNILQQSKIDTLQWQLKEIEKSREMHRAVMKQVVAFLEKTHHSLGILVNKSKQAVPRSKSEHQMTLDSQKTQEEKITESFAFTDKSMSYTDMSWRRPKKQDIDCEEVSPEKLAQEAFRLLRTAQSLLNTREPDLAQMNAEPEDDMDFLASLAKEFPPPLDNKPQRTTSFSLSPKLLLPEYEVKVSTALNRKLSLQLTERRSSITKPIRTIDSARGSFAENETAFTSSTIHDFNKDLQNISFSSQKSEKYRCKESEKSNSPPAGSISSVEDESGFSSMNSFQDVGVPLFNSTALDEVSTKNALLRSMLHNNSSLSSLEPSSLIDCTLVPNDTIEKSKDNRNANIEDIKLWQTPKTSTPAHNRWHSNPVEEGSRNSSLKVLWV
ncbi:unnamed protein product [Brassicogethes aeneus]|uniref:Uncharacterized protein n=1 Tax=Brassicogethes aeneus TaxID=1431903 RepID=A0A9P0FA67_BRAAE|nr:unnamed protein product [Brassicogethes aeneus]